MPSIQDRAQQCANTEIREAGHGTVTKNAKAPTRMEGQAQEAGLLGTREARTPDLRITRAVVRLDHTEYETCALANCAMVPNDLWACYAGSRIAVEWQRSEGGGVAEESARA